MIFRNLKREELESWYDLTGEVFAQTGREYFVRHIMNDPWPVLESVFVAEDDGKLAATVRVFHRRVYLNGKAFRMGGIGEVSTRPEYRKQGLSSKLLEMAVAYMENNGFDMSFLFTGVNPHYAKQGYMDVPVEFAEAAPSIGRGDLELRMGKAADLPAMQGLYDLYAPQFDGATLRDSEAYWKRWVTYEMRGNLLVALKDGELVGYIAYTKANEGKIGLNDYAQAPGEDVFQTLCYAACKRQGAEKIFYPRALNPRMKAEVSTSNAMMVRLIRPIELNETVSATKDLVKAFRKTVTFGVDAF